MNISIVIPVYNAFDEAARCLESVRQHTSPEVRVLVIDDASPEGKFAESISSGLKGWESLHIYRNGDNSGFTNSCNRGIKEADQDDVVLLNSDTVVTQGWLESLSKAAYSRDSVGTVTPFTNNGTVCSIPTWMEDNEIPIGCEIDTFAELVQEVGQGDYPMLPTCVGFCVYIKREVFQRVGLLDASRFPKGYGEENDFSLRLQKAGYLDILDDNCFVYHEGGKSFGTSHQRLREEGTAVLQKHYPHYFDTVSRFVRENPLRDCHERIHRALIKRVENQRGAGRVLHILHNGPYAPLADPIGGTERALQRIIAAEKNFSHWALVAWRGELRLQFCTPTFQKEFRFPESEIEAVLDSKIFPLIHVHHTRWFKARALIEALQKHGNVVTSLHDFVSLCPRFHLMTTRGELCTGVECSSICGYRDSFIREYREMGRALLQLSKKVFAFSENTREYVRSILGWEGEAEVMQHGVALERTECGAIEKEVSTLRVGLFGIQGRHKGEEIFRQLSTVLQLPKSKKSIEWHCFGEANALPHVKFHGKYDSNSLPEMVRAVRPHCILFLSLCPETYSIAVDEAIALGVPVVVSPQGAPMERVRRYGVGWVLESLAPEIILRSLEQVATDWSLRREEILSKLQSYPLKSTRWEAQTLCSYYQSLIGEKMHESQPHIESLLVRASPPRAVPGKIQRVFTRGIDVAVFLLDRLKLRYWLQSRLTTVLPTRFYQQLRQLRGIRSPK